MNRESKQAAKDLIVGDSRTAHTLLPHLVGTVALAVTSPPYHNAISYNSHIADPRTDYRAREESSYHDDYLPLLAEVWAACWALLRPGGQVVPVNVVEIVDGLMVATAQGALGGSCRVSLVSGGLSISPMASTPM